MLIFIDPEGNYPRFVGDLMATTPGWSVGDSIPEGWQVVEETPLPPISEGQTFNELAPAVVDGVLKQIWEVRDLTEEEIARVNAPKTARAKLIALGLTDAEIDSLVLGIR